MSAATTGYRHIDIDAGGVPIIAGTGYKVVPLIEQLKARGWTAEELQEHYPDLTPAQVHSVLAYYFDHAGEIGAEIARRARLVDDLRHQTAPPRVATRLRQHREGGES